MIMAPLLLAGQSGHVQTIFVNGSATVKGTPDLTGVYINIHEEDLDYQKCLDEALTVLTNLTNSFTKAGFDEKELKTSNVDVREKIRWQEGKEIRMGYQASASVSIEFPFSNEILKKVFDLLSDYSNKVNYHIGFKLSEEKEEQLIQKALQLAVKDARSKAEILVKASEVELGKIIEIQYGQPETGQKYLESASFAARAQSDASRPDINPSEVSITEEISIRWEIR